MKLELAHDIIAQKIAQKVSVEDKQVKKIFAFIKERYKIYNSRKTGLLEKEDIDYIKPFLEKLDLTKDESRFVQSSIRSVRNKRILKFLLGFTILTLVSIIGFTAIYLQFRSEEYKVILKNKEELLKEKTKEIELKSDALKDKLKEEEELDTRLSKIHTILENTKQSIAESEKTIEEKLSLIQGIDSVLKKDNQAKLDFFRNEMAKAENWSELQGESDWESAQKKCQSIGQILPNKWEWESVFLKNPDLVLKWKSEKCCKYWTIHADALDKASLIDITTGNIENVFKDNTLPVRCIK